MKQTIAAYTAPGCNYPEFINISCNESGEYEITGREAPIVDVSKHGTHVMEGKMFSITLSSQAFMELVDELNEKF